MTITHQHTSTPAQLPTATPPTRTRGRKPSGGPGSCGGMMGKAWFRLPQEHADAVTAIAAQRGCSTSEVYGEAVTRYLEVTRGVL